MNKNIQKLKEEIRAKLKENWDEIAYFDVLYYRTWELINEKEEYFGLSAWEVLDYGFLDYESFLRKGRVKDWISLFKEYYKSEKKYKGNQGPFGFALPGYFLDYALEGLVLKLKEGEISQEESEKLNPLLLKDILTFKEVVYAPYGALPDFYTNLVKAIGVIGSRKSILFLKRIIEWVDKHGGGQMGEYGERRNDYSHYLREAAVRDLVKITGSEEAEFLFKRFHKDGSPSVQEAIFEELEKMTTEEAMQYVTILRNMVPYRDIEGNYGEYHHYPENEDEVLKRKVIVELEKTRKDEDLFDTLYSKAISMSKSKEFAGIDPVKVLKDYFDFDNHL
ncbi:MAG: hypothetical protein GPJ52_00185 [Candidatus Heimdallarchaeota archaeon]|nr:hypothetical protein [Candidatus Heimdallarchaeota archaeon]